MLKEISISVKLVKFTGEDGKEKTFNAFTTFSNTGEKLDVRFVKDAVAKAPKENCIVVVDSADMNISRKFKYPRLYIQAVTETKPIVYKEQDLPF